jgi:hypothetical protein
LHECLRFASCREFPDERFGLKHDADLRPQKVLLSGEAAGSWNCSEWAQGIAARISEMLRCASMSGRFARARHTRQ